MSHIFQQVHHSGNTSLPCIDHMWLGNLQRNRHNGSPQPSQWAFSSHHHNRHVRLPYRLLHTRNKTLPHLKQLTKEFFFVAFVCIELKVGLTKTFPTFIDPRSFLSRLTPHVPQYICIRGLPLGHTSSRCMWNCEYSWCGCTSQWTLPTMNYAQNYPSNVLETV